MHLLSAVAAAAVLLVPTVLVLAPGSSVLAPPASGEVSVDRATTGTASNSTTVAVPIPPSSDASVGLAEGKAEQASSPSPPCVPGVRPATATSPAALVGREEVQSSSLEPSTPTLSALAGSSSSVVPSFAAVLKTAESSGVCPSAIFLPRAPATATELAQASAGDGVAPLYQGIPVPIGLADYGLSEGPGGSVLASVQNTTSVRGSVDANATGIRPVELDMGAPDAFGIQLNAVLTDVDLFGATAPSSGALSGTPYEFWAQNVVEYYPSAQYLVLVTNLWNFSGAASLGSAIYQHGPDGLNLGALYEATLPILTPVTYPFNLTLFLNSSVIDGRDALNFSVQLAGPGEGFSEPYDYVVFNSIAQGGSPAIAPANFTADGRQYDPLGLTNDFELDVGGPGAGSQADLVAADADFGLAVWSSSGNGGSGGYVSVPSAYNYGGETGETATGATVTWSNVSGGPAGLSTYGTMATGPTFLAGLWNATGPEGSYPVTIDSRPSNAFEVVSPAVSLPWSNLTYPVGLVPVGRSDYQEAYDPALGSTVLFGGNSSGVLGDTWIFSSGSWAPAFSSPAPPARFGGGLVYDAAMSELVLFGGQALIGGSATGPSEFLNDTWVLNATGWHQLHPAHAPSSRADFAMAYDAADAEVLLFGGGGGIGIPHSRWTLYNDTWTFQNGQWSNITSTVGSAPSPRIDTSAVFDPTDGYVLLAGGASGGPTLLDPCGFTLSDQWVFSGGHWSKLTVTGTAPPAGAGSLWFDSSTSTTYYFEEQENLTAVGEGCRAVVDDVWSYAHGNWTLLAPGGLPNAPPQRFGAEVVDDEADHVELLFSGQAGVNGPYLSDWWSFQPSAVTPGKERWVVAEASVGPTITTPTFWLAPGNYSVETELSGYLPSTTTVDVTGPVSIDPSLVASASVGIYTPLWAWSNAQVPAISTAGAGTPSDPYVLESNQPGPINSTFGLYNDYAYPVFPAVFLLGTTVSIEILRPANFTTLTNNFTAPGPALPSINFPPFWFDQVHGVALLDASTVGRGWFDMPVTVADASVVFFESSGNLVAGCTFRGTAPVGLLMFSGGTFQGPLNVGGGNNTVWGNTFNVGGMAGNALVAGGMALVLAEPNDLLYNNRFVPGVPPSSFFSGGIPFPGWDAWLLPANLYSGDGEQFANDRWNITVQSATVKHYAAGFPEVPLVGSILGTSWQGGNYWWDYGLYMNPYGTLPFQEVLFGTVYISPGGDFAPLLRTPLAEVTLSASGLPAGQAGLLAISNVSYLGAANGYLLDNVSLNASTTSVYLPPGSYPYLITSPSGYRWLGGSIKPTGTLKVPRAGRSVQLAFGPGSTVSVTFTATGIPTGSVGGFQPVWCMQFAARSLCGSPSVTFADLTPATRGFAGRYAFTVLPDFSAVPFILANSGLVPAQGTVAVKGNTTVAVSYLPAYVITFDESGLPIGSSWSVTVHGVRQWSPAGDPAADSISFIEQNGTYHFAIGSEPGFRASVGTSKVTVNGANVDVQVTFTAKRK